MIIHKNFVGGNISVKKHDGNTFILENELRDTAQDWFYWAFCIEGAQGRELTFKFQDYRLGYYGPAVSCDLVNWHWLDSVDENSFTYSFSEKEDKVYFAHSMLYHPDRFLKFAKKHNLSVNELCKGYKGSSVPCVSFGEGKTSVILTARHHACESTGSYVLEGVLEELINNPIEDFKVFCVPFVDYEGVIRGDQGKGRVPYDHNRGYDEACDSVYPECNAIKKYAEKNGCCFGFDFHSPWHISNENDTVFIVQNSIEKANEFNRFGIILEKSITSDSLKYEHKNDYPFGVGWNKNVSGKQFGKQFANYMGKRKENKLSFTLETAYFGTPQNKVTEEKLLNLGHCFANALREYVFNML